MPETDEKKNIKPDNEKAPAARRDGLTGDTARSKPARGRDYVASATPTKAADASIDVSGGVKWDPDAYPKVNNYYMDISKRWKVLKFALIIVTVVYLVFMISAFSSDITVENFRYLLKDLDSGSIKHTGDYEKIIYDSSSGSSFALFKGDLAVVRAGKTSLYNMSGSAVLSLENNFYSPRVASSDKYFIAYDIGDTTKTYTVYNAFSELKTEKLDCPISAAVICGTGMYAVVTSNDDYKGVINIYNSSFSKLSVISKDKYIASVALKNDGSELLGAAMYDDNGDWCAEIFTVTPGKTSENFSLTLTGVMPVKVAYTGGGFTVLCDESLLFFDADGNGTGRYDFGSDVPLICETGERYTVLAFNKNVIGNDKTVLIFNGTGDILYSGVHSGELGGALCGDTWIALIMENKLIRIEPESGDYAEFDIESGCLAVLKLESDKLMICYAGTAHPIDFAAPEKE